MRLYVRNRQRRFALEREALLHTFHALATSAEAWSLCFKPWREITLHLLGDRGISHLNRVILGHSGPTDVITQRYTALPGEPPGLIGEIFVNVTRAATSAPAGGRWSADQELALYIAHGCNHLAGAEDNTAQERNSMRRRELAWLRRIALPPLFHTPPSNSKDGSA